MGSHDGAGVGAPAAATTGEGSTCVLATRAAAGAAAGVSHPGSHEGAGAGRPSSEAREDLGEGRGEDDVDGRAPGGSILKFGEARRAARTRSVGTMPLKDWK